MEDDITLGSRVTIAQLKDLKVRGPSAQNKRHIAIYQNETSWVAAIIIDGEGIPVQTKRGQIKAYRNLDSLLADLRRVFGDQDEFTLTVAPVAVTSIAALQDHLKQQ